MSDFEHTLNDASGNPVASLSIVNPSGNPLHLVVPKDPDSISANAPGNPFMAIHLTEHMPESHREETSLEYHKLAGVLGFDSKRLGNADVHVNINGNIPESLMLFVGDHLTRNHNVSEQAFTDFKTHLQTFEAELQGGKAIDPQLHLQDVGALLLRSGAEHTSQAQHDPVREVAGMGGPAPSRGPELWNI